MSIQDKIQAEFLNAENSRLSGNEGKARVCARRAAGMALREYLISISRDRPELNNFEILVDNGIRQILPGEIHPALNHLTMRVGMDYNLPAGIDLLKDARQVVQILNKGENNG